MFDKPNTLIYLQRGSLMLAGKRMDAARLEFPEDVVKNMEVIQRGKLLELVEKFLRDHGIHGRRVLLVLDNSILFHKAIELDQSGKPDLLMQGFVDAMPFEPGQRACLAVETDARLRLYATNADLYQAVADAIHASGAGKLIGITPSSAYVLDSTDRSISGVAERFFADKMVPKVADFRSVVPV